MEGFSCPAQELHQLDNMWAKLAESSLCVHHILIARRRNKCHFGKLGNFKCTSYFICSDDFKCILSSYDVPTNVFVTVLTRQSESDTFEDLIKYR